MCSVYQAEEFLDQSSLHHSVPESPHHFQAFSMECKPRLVRCQNIPCTPFLSLPFLVPKPTVKRHQLFTFGAQPIRTFFNILESRICLNPKLCITTAFNSSWHLQSSQNAQKFGGVNNGYYRHIPKKGIGAIWVL